MTIRSINWSGNNPITALDKPFYSVVEKEALTQLMLNIDPITSFQSNEYNNISIMIQHEHDEESSENPDMMMTR